MKLIDKALKRTIKNAVRTAIKPAVNNIKGAIGEQRVSSKLNPVFEEIEHRQINNLILVDANNKSHQIDHIEIRPNGIFCIETKNYAGWIFGGESQPMWTQTIYNEKHQFVNPIKQNRSHIYHLNQILNGKYRINSLIVMVQNNADRIDIPYVINLKELKRYLADSDDGTHYTQDEMDTIYRIIINASRPDVTHQEHLQNIRETQNEIEQNRCPRCGNKLILKKGKYGDFFGCSDYPNCKFIKKT